MPLQKWTMLFTNDDKHIGYRKVSVTEHDMKYHKVIALDINNTLALKGNDYVSEKFNTNLVYVAKLEQGLSNLAFQVTAFLSFVYF